MAKKKSTFPTEVETVEYEMLEELLASSFLEVKEFSKKKPDEALNKLKVTSLNRILSRIKNILKNEPTSDFLDLLDEDAIPTNSDAVLIIAQFKAAMSQFRGLYYGRVFEFEAPRWFTKENPGTHHTSYRKRR